ncbi:hypothetical protein JY651_10230 [Pyxidicoccus parkwayensis]|uniref:Lipoprotein n=1 Tax=Pyxidicoccus parkwayensis TaxID=2813578 RepID=A0ABX7P4D6_9BACT|nr:hypothetical protein [Pyxidicoccus parkwaysis]QSQ25272.1 hypothetical protein JY651_10230 [Pyxidicoccus parkwaysis]
MTRLAAALFLILLSACEKPTPKEPTATQEFASAKGPAAAKEPTAAEVLGVKPDFTPRYAVATTERFDVGGVPRLSMKVTVPRGLTREDLEANVRHALLRAYESGPVKFGAVSVLAYASAKTNSVYDAAKGDFAPGGKWSASSTTVPLSEWKAQVDFSDLYFQERTYLAAGTRAVLVLANPEFSKTVQVSRKAGRWQDEDTVAELKPGIPVVVVGHEDFGIAGVRYEVETVKGPKCRGWVHAFDLKAK